MLQTVAEVGKGVDTLVETLDRHRAWLEASGELGRRRRNRLAERVREAVDRRLQSMVWRERGGQAVLDGALDDLVAGRQTPYAVADQIAKTLEG